ncbi:MAG TPA: hypothetical protein VD763_02770 [Candidatus Saccharimonadales bacterium]|nr:hypothetical protein [Candidatus Saccharimonadales bacterium]
MPDSSPPATAAPPEPGERRLDRPPSDRYRESTPTAPDGGAAAGSPDRRPRSARRAMAYAITATLLGALATIILGGVLAISAGLLVVAVVAGRAIGLGLIVGDDGSLTSTRRTSIAIGLALASVVIGQLGLWWYASTEGGVLGPIDYLAQTFGILVPLQALLTTAVAWWTAR